MIDQSYRGTSRLWTVGTELPHFCQSSVTVVGHRWCRAYSARRVEQEPVDTTEVPKVARHELEPVMDGGGSNQNIGIADDLPAPAEITSNGRKPAQDRPGQWQDIDAPEEGAECSLCTLWIPPLVDALVDLAVGHQADCDALGGKQRDRRLPLHQIFSHPVGIDQVPHSSTGGRVEILRLS